MCCLSGAASPKEAEASKALAADSHDRTCSPSTEASTLKHHTAQESGIHPSVVSKYVNNQVREISLTRASISQARVKRRCAALKRFS